MEVKKVATFQDRFSELVESSTKSRTTIASEFGVAKQTISAWTTGQTSPRLPVVSSLADYFGVSCNWLLGFDVPKYPIKENQEDPPDNLSGQYVPKTIEARSMAKGMDTMPEARRKAFMDFLISMAPDIVGEGKENDET